MKAKRIAELKNAMLIASINHDWLTASLLRAELNGVITPVEKPCSDQLRAELTANNIEMNRLTERNDAILSTLRGRGLEPVRASNEPLTRQEIHARDWFCRDGSVECRRVLLDVYDYTVRNIAITDDDVSWLNKREIIRKGNQFYYV